MIKDTTESIPPPERWLDRLNDEAALTVMAQDQAAAAEAVMAALPAIRTAAAAIFERLAETPHGRLFYGGAGTSARIGVQDGAELTPSFGWPRQRVGFLIAGGKAALIEAAEGAEDDTEAAIAAVAGARIGADDVLICLAASGTTPFTCAAARAGRQAGAVIIGIASNAGTPLLDAADHPIALLTGSESPAGSTRLKAGTAQKICLNMISTLVMTRMGTVQDGMMVDMQTSNAKLRVRRQRIDALLKGQRPPMGQRPPRAQ